MKLHYKAILTVLICCLLFTGVGFSVPNINKVEAASLTSAKSMCVLEKDSKSGKVKIYSEDIFEFDFNGLWLDIDKIKNIVSNIDYLVLSHWKCCFLSCSYCVEKKTDDLNTIKHFDIMPIVEQLIDVGLVTKETQIVFSCGDATLHPEFDKLL